MYFNNCVEGKISDYLFDTAHKTLSAQEARSGLNKIATVNLQ